MTRRDAPLPWEAQEHDKEGCGIISMRPGTPKGGTPTNGMVAFVNRRLFETHSDCEARAAFIVRACNLHEPLVAALKEAIEELNSMCEEIDGERFNRPAWNELIRQAEDHQ